MIYLKDISLPKEWTLEHEVSSTKILADELKLDYIQQHVDDTIKISFDHPLVINERKKSFVRTKSSFTSETLERRGQNLKGFQKIMLRQLNLLTLI